MIVIYTGRRPSAEGGGFPATGQAWVVERLDRLLAGLRPRLVVGSAAAGADLLVLAAALGAGAAALVLITEDRRVFRSASVEDKGPAWSAAYDALLGRPEVTVMPVPVRADDQGFAVVNEKILAAAGAARSADEEIVVLGVTAGRRAGRDHSEDLLAAAQAADHLVLRIDPTAQRDATPTAFVAMPYGIRRAETKDGRDWNADATWHRILVPALLDAAFRPVRADLEASMEIIDSKMIRAIGEADLLVADLSQHNPNVFWEIGLRHAWQPSGTLLLKAQGSPRPPFDVARVPVYTYERGSDGVEDRDAVAAIRMVRGLLAAPRATDSPVFAAIPDLGPVAMPLALHADSDEQVSRLAERLSLAADLRDPDKIMQVVAGLPAALSAGTRALIKEQAGLALVDLSQHEQALELLEPLADDDPEFGRIRLQQRYALALMHAKEPSAERGQRLRTAALRLQRLAQRHPGSPETLGLLGGAAKRAFLLAQREGQEGLPHLDQAVDAYEAGFAADPTDYFPGINAVALRRIRGQLLLPGTARAEQDLARARQLRPVVAFALARPQLTDTPWQHATRGELSLHEYLLGADEALAAARQHYERAVQEASPFQVDSMREQLNLFLDLGDPPAAIHNLLQALPGGSSGTASAAPQHDRQG